MQNSLLDRQMDVVLTTARRAGTEAERAGRRYLDENGLVASLEVPPYQSEHRPRCLLQFFATSTVNVKWVGGEAALKGKAKILGALLSVPHSLGREGRSAVHSRLEKGVAQKQTRFTRFLTLCSALDNFDWVEYAFFCAAGFRRRPRNLELRAERAKAKNMGPASRTAGCKSGCCV